MTPDPDKPDTIVQVIFIICLTIIITTALIGVLWL